jgi:hypothetical protein
MTDRSITCRSVVFPRNQFAPESLAICRDLGIEVFRGTEGADCYRPGPGSTHTPVRRLARLVDSYVDVTGANTTAVRRGGGDMVNVPASRFLRPYHPTLRVLDGLRRRRILRAMDHAARRGESFHLWWHPHNFGIHLEENLGFLRDVLLGFTALRERHGMQSRNMSEVAAQ